MGDELHRRVGDAVFYSKAGDEFLLTRGAADAIADAVLSALGLERAGWLHADGGVCPVGVHHPAVTTCEPLYRLSKGEGETNE